MLTTAWGEIGVTDHYCATQLFSSLKEQFSDKSVFDVFSTSEVRMGNMNSLHGLCTSSILVYRFLKSENHWKLVFPQNRFWCSFDPGSGGRSHDPFESGLSLIHTHIRASHVRKRLETSFQRKWIFDVSLTPIVEEGHMSLLEVLRDRFHSNPCSPCPKTTGNEFSQKNNFRCFFDPESGGGHVTPLEVTWDWSTLIFMLPMLENHWKWVFRKKQFRCSFDLHKQTHIHTHTHTNFFSAWPSLQSRELESSGNNVAQQMVTVVHAPTKHLLNLDAVVTNGAVNESLRRSYSTVYGRLVEATWFGRIFSRSP